MKIVTRQAGFSLTEMLVASAIAAFGLAGVGALIGHGIRLQGNARASAQGVNLAVAELERLRGLPAASVERTNGGSLTANVANKFAVRGQTTLRWVVADGPACGPPTTGGPGAPVAWTKTVTIVALPQANTLAAAARLNGLLWR